MVKELIDLSGLSEQEQSITSTYGSRYMSEPIPATELLTHEKVPLAQDPYQRSREKIC